MKVFETTNFKVLEILINGIRYFFVCKNIECGGYMFSCTTLNDAIFACKQWQNQNAYEIGTLIERS